LISRKKRGVSSGTLHRKGFSSESILKRCSAGRRGEKRATRPFGAWGAQNGDLCRRKGKSGSPQSFHRGNGAALQDGRRGEGVIYFQERKEKD